MNEMVKSFLDAKKQEERKKYDEKKEKILLELGFYEKIYSEKEGYSAEFPFSEYDSVNSKSKWYRKEVLNLTDEEYEELKKYSVEETQAGNNSVANILNIIAIVIFIGGFILGIIMGYAAQYVEYVDGDFSFVAAFTYWCTSFISGMVFLGFAEIIKLLDVISKNNKR